ncbi:MAG TPA: ABC transporter substrate-binding protein [Stellaceae bacterium]
MSRSLIGLAAGAFFALASHAWAATPDCGDNTGKAATGKPIPIGAVTSISLNIGQGDRAALAYFTCVNANGGIHGRPITYHDFDDQGKLDIAAQAAKKLVDDEGVYLMVGSTSIVECAANGAFYLKKNVLDIGIGIAPPCYRSKNIAPVNGGPRQTAIGGADYARRLLGAKSFTCVTRKIPGAEYFCRGVEAWGQKYRVKVTSIYTDPTSIDFASEVLQILATGADAVMAIMPGDQGIQLLAAAEAQDGAARMKWTAPTTFYTAEFPGAIDSKYWNKRLWVNTELGDLAGQGVDNQNWLAVEKAYGGKRDLLDNTAQADYIAARIAVRAMLSIKGAVDRDAVTEALRNAAPYHTDILCSDWYWGGPDASEHNANHVTRMITIDNGKWKTVEGCFPDLDPGLASIVALENRLGINGTFNAEYERAK